MARWVAVVMTVLLVACGSSTAPDAIRNVETTGTLTTEEVAACVDEANRLTGPKRTQHDFVRWAVFYQACTNREAND